MPSEREMNFKRFPTQSEASFHVNNIKDNNFASNSRFPEVILFVLFTINIKDILNNKPLKQDCIKFNRSMIIDIKCANLLCV
jgi:hypothetical protein